MVETKATLDDLPGVVLAGLEHLDERYLRVIRYSTKAPRPVLPKRVAVAAEARTRFWTDRARTAAIAAHTNAFNVNTDVVIPLSSPSLRRTRSAFGDSMRTLLIAARRLTKSNPSISTLAAPTASSGAPPAR